MHPLTEIVYDDWHMKEGKEVIDLRVRIWLQNKAREFCGMCPYEKIQEILELPEVKK